MTTPTDEQLLDHVRAALIARRAQHTVAARFAGMPDTSARRWPRYLERCERAGKQPIALEDAVGQCLVARALAGAR